MQKVLSVLLMGLGVLFDTCQSFSQAGFLTFDNTTGLAGVYTFAFYNDADGDGQITYQTTDLAAGESYQFNLNQWLSDNGQGNVDPAYLDFSFASDDSSLNFGSTVFDGNSLELYNTPNDSSSGGVNYVGEFSPSGVQSLVVPEPSFLLPVSFLAMALRVRLSLLLASLTRSTKLWLSVWSLRLFWLWRGLCGAH